MFNHLEKILIWNKMKIHLENNDILLPGRKFFCKTSGKHRLLKRFFFTVTVMPNSFPRSSSCFPLDILYGSSKITNFLSRSDAKLLWDRFLQKKWGLFVLWFAVSFEKNEQHLSVSQVAEISKANFTTVSPLRSDNGQFTLVEEIPPGTTDVGVA